MGAPERPFGRFIPKEHVGDVASWEFQPLGGAAKSPPRGGAATAAAMNERERRAFERGRQQGFHEGQQEAQRQKAQHARQLERVLDELRGRFAELESNAADALLDLAIEIARQVVRREVEIQRDAVLPVVREAVTAIVDEQTHPRVHLHPDDLWLIQADLDTDGLYQGCRFVPDPAVARGGCRVQTVQSEVDATLATRWRRALGALGVDADELPPIEGFATEDGARDADDGERGMPPDDAPRGGL
ncbi:MAG: flagellar assembly protein FliH [Burkholderiaceae bacterium]